MAADDHQQHPKHGKTTTAGAVSPNATKKPKERVPFKSELTEINQYLMCPLCSGYLIDATAIIECQHTFCKSCILKYLETNSYCPICDVQLNKAKPHLSLRSDVIVQRLVYKLVPGLLVSELRRRRDCAQVGSSKQEAAESASSGMALEVEAATDLSTILSLEDVVSLSIEYFRSGDTEDDLNTDSKQQIATLQKQEQQQTTPNVHNIQDIKSPTESEEEANDRRYLQCPAAVSVGLLKKFIRMKYGLSDDYRVDLLYNGGRDNMLENDLTLLDVAFIFKWNKDEPMRFHYRIFDRTVKSLTARSGTKRSAPSMMDEPPDDDAASGPQNRPSMTSASTSSKIPRLSDNSTTGANNNAGNTGGSYTRSTSTLSSSTPVYDFSEGNSDSEEITKNVKSRGFHRKYSSSSSNSCNTNNNKNSSSSSNSDKSSSHILKRSPSSLRSHTSRSQSSEGKAAGVVKATNATLSNRKSTSTNTSSATTNNRGRSNSVGNPVNNTKNEEGDSDSLEGDSSEISKTSDRSAISTVTNSRLRSAAQQVMQSQVNGSVKLSISTCNISREAKKESLKVTTSSSVTKSSERKHKHRHHKMKHKEKNKSQKVNVNQIVNHQNTSSINQNMSQNHKSSGKEVKLSLGKASKLNAGLGNNNKGVEGKGNGNGSSGNNSTGSQSNFPNAMKSAASAHLSNISKSISVSIGVNMSGNNSSGNVTNSSYNQSSSKGNQFSSKILASTTGLLPKNTGIEIQATTISGSNSQHNSNSSNTNTGSNQSVSRSHPFLPESVHVPKSVTLIPVNPNAMNPTLPGRGNSNCNPPEKSGSGTSNRLNAHTFTHPITNKSLHQITVTEVPPPPKSRSSSPANNSSSSGGNIGSANNNSGTHSNTGPSNPIEKVIANATNNKPQFHGPGSMEITKIYCGAKENPAKKLKERKGLDISISVPGMNNVNNIKDKSKTQKLEETLRQKMGMSNSVTSTAINNKMKGVSQTPSTLFNAKMPPGITVGPAAINKNVVQCVSSSPITAVNNNNTGNTIKGLGFTLPPHITAHPQQPSTGIRNNTVNQVKLTEKPIVNRPPNKDNGGQTNPNINRTKVIPENGKLQSGSKNLNNNRKHLGEALASMLDMAARTNMKSPSPPKTSHLQSKDHNNKLTSSPFSNQTSRDGILPSNTNCEKRALDMSPSSRKNSRESPEPKRSRTNESTTSKLSSSSNNETPLDLSGRSSRPNSNSSSPTLGNLKNTASKSPNLEKPKTSNEVSFNLSGNNNNNNNSKKSPTPVPKVSPPTAPSSRNVPSPSISKSNQDISRNSQKSSISPGSTTPSILSIAQSLAQKQLNQQQQQLSQQQQQQQQNLHNQIMQLHQGLNQNSINHNLHGKSANTGPKGSHNGNMSISGGTASMGLTTHSQPMITMPNTSPTNTSFDPLRNLLTLSDAAVRHGKVHPMNNLIAAVGLCTPPPSHNHGFSMPSPTAVSTGGLFSHLSPHLVNSLGGKSPTGMFDPSNHALFGNLSALSAAHNERLAVAAGLNHFGGSLSPPLSLANSFYSQVRPPSNNPHGSLRIPTVTPKCNSVNNSKKGSTPPLSFTHPPSISAPHSPNNNSSQTKARSSPPVSISSNLTSVSSSSTIAHSKTSTDSYSSASNMKMKNTKINGTLSNHLPIYPPGIHNPLLPIYSRSQTSTSSVTGSSSNSTSTSKVTHSDKKGIPNSMKISNFLPSKPKDGKSIDNSNVEATITSGSNIGGTSLTKFLNSIPPLIAPQSQPNLSLSSPKESSRLSSTAANKSTNAQECSPACTSSSSNIQTPSDSIVPTASLSLDECNSSNNSSLMNSIKNEPESEPSLSKSTSDPIPHVANIKTTSPSPQASTSSEVAKTNDLLKSNSCEIKLEKGGLTTSAGTESCSGRVTVVGHSTIGILGFGSAISPPSTSSGRATQPQNQTVRHIPNPALLFNRQNNSNQIGSLITPLANATSAAAASPIKISPETAINQKSPVKLDEHPFPVPALPFPGVSVPVQVKVDNDAIPIPILIPNPSTNISKDNETKEPKIISEIKELTILSPLKVEPSHQQPQTNFVQEMLKEEAPLNAKEEAKISQVEHESKSVKHNQICKQEEILKIEYNLDDTDADIDVGTETTLIQFSNDDNDTIEKSQEEECVQAEEQKSHSDSAITEEVQISDDIIQADEVSLQIGSNTNNTPSSPNNTATNEIKIVERENTTDIISQLDDDDCNASKDDLSEEGKATEVTNDVVKDLNESKHSEPKCSFEEDHMEIDSQPDILSSSSPKINSAAEKVEEVDGEIGNKKESEIELDVQAKDVPMDEPMEVNIVKLLKPVDDTLLEENKKLSLEIISLPPAESSEEVTEAPMEVIETATSGRILENENITTDNLQIDIISETVPTIDDNVEDMECEEPLPEDQPKEMEVMDSINSINESSSEMLMESNSFDVNVEQVEPTISCIVTGDASLSKINTNVIIPISEPAVVVEEMEGVIINEAPQSASPPSTPMENKDETVEKNLLPSLIPEQAIESIVEDLNPISNSDSNLISNQITINPEALQVVDTNDKKTGDLEVAEANKDNEPANIKEASESVNSLENKPEAFEEELMESSSSSSQLELNCPSADTNGIELTNPVTPELIVHSNNSSIDHTKKDLDINGASEKCDSIQEKSEDLIVSENTLPCNVSTTPSIAEATETAESEDKSPNIIKPEDSISMNPILTNVQETPTETSIIEPSIDVDPPKATTNVALPSDAKVDNSVVPYLKSEPSESEQEKVMDSAESESAPEIISATATITTTTTTAEISTAVTKTVEIEVDFRENALQSSISSIKSLTSPISSDCNITKMETLEKVAAGLFASAATSINNNNNTSLSINTPCDITITTTNANDMTTV